QRLRQLAVREPMIGFSRDGRYYASSNFREGALVRDIDDAQDVARITKDVIDRSTSAVALSPDRHSLAVSLDDGATGNYGTLVWDVQTGALRCRFDADGDARALAFSPDGRLLAAGGIGNTARVWALDGCREIARIVSADEIVGVAFSPDATLLATGG